MILEPTHTPYFKSEDRFIRDFFGETYYHVNCIQSQKEVEVLLSSQAQKGGLTGPLKHLVFVPG